MAAIARPLMMHSSLRAGLRGATKRFTSSAAPRSSANTLLMATLSAAGVGGALYYVNGLPQAPAKLQADAPSHGIPTLKGDDQWIDLKLQHVEKYNHNTSVFRFELPSEEHVSGLNICSAILTKYQGPEDEKPTMRPYTPISDENATGYLDLMVKRYDKGPMSEHIHNMAPDQRLSFKGPLPKYSWHPNKHEHIALIAGGTGITPMFQLVRKIFNNPDDETSVTLVFGNVTEDDILLREEFASLENEYPNRFRTFFVLDHPREEWQGGKGFITKELLAQALPSPKRGDKVHAFVCGPPPLYKAISGMKKSVKEQGELTGALRELGWSAEQVYKF